MGFIEKKCSDLKSQTLNLGMVIKGQDLNGSAQPTNCPSSLHMSGPAHFSFYLLIFVFAFVYFCICVFVYLCVCVFLNLCIAQPTNCRSSLHMSDPSLLLFLYLYLYLPFGICVFVYLCICVFVYFFICVLRNPQKPAAHE